LFRYKKISHEAVAVEENRCVRKEILYETHNFLYELSLHPTGPKFAALNQGLTIVIYDTNKINLIFDGWPSE